MSTVTINLTQEELRALDVAAEPGSREAFCAAAVRAALHAEPEPKSATAEEEED